MTTQELVSSTNLSSDIERVLLTGDLGRLSPDERLSYYKAVCDSVGLNPLTNPFQYLQLNGKTILYAAKGCTDQLRSIHGVSVLELSESTVSDVFVVTAKVQNAKGRVDMAKGAVALGNLKGEALANALMKCETKAKRRATLSICGLGMLDETEVETIPGAVKFDKDAYVEQKVAELKSAPPAQTAVPSPIPGAAKGGSSGQSAPAANSAAEIAGDQIRITVKAVDTGLTIDKGPAKGKPYIRVVFGEGKHDYINFFDTKMHEQVKTWEAGDVVTISYITNEKGYKNVKGIVHVQKAHENQDAEPTGEQMFDSLV